MRRKTLELSEMQDIANKILHENTEIRKNPLFREKTVTVKPSEGKGNGLFTDINVKQGELILLSKVYMMSDQDWELIKDTEPVKLYGFRWNDEYGIPLGKWKFDFTNLKDKFLWKKTEFYKNNCPNGLRLSGFLYVNDIDVHTTANVKEVFNVPKNIVGIKAIRDIQAGEELIKEYNYDWREEFTSWRKGILEGLNLPKKQNSKVAQYVIDKLRGAYTLMRPTGPLPSLKEIYTDYHQLIALYDTKTHAAWINVDIIRDAQKQFGAEMTIVRPTVIDQFETQFKMNINQLFDDRYRLIAFLRDGE